MAAEVYRADHGDADTLVDSVVQAQTHLNEAGVERTLEEVVVDKGYHAAKTLELAQSLSFRTYVPEPKHAYDRKWTDKPAEYQAAVYANRRRMKRAKGKRLQRSRSEMTERTFAHLCETGGARRSWLRGLEKVQKRWVIHAAARNLGRIMRKLFKRGTARGLQAAGGLVLLLSLASLIVLTAIRTWRRIRAMFTTHYQRQRMPIYRFT